MINPTNPITPLVATEAAATSDAVPYAATLIRSTRTPRYAAVSSPTASRLSGRASASRRRIAGTRYRVRGPIPSHEAPLKEPMIQNMAARYCSRSAKVSRSRMQALKNAPTTTPASRSTRVSRMRPTLRAIPKTSPIASNAPANAARGSASVETAARPNTVAPTAPTAAPPEMPRMYGSASGLRSRA